LTYRHHFIFLVVNIFCISGIVLGTSEFLCSINTLFSSIVPKYVNFPLTIEYLNTLYLKPFKDYEMNRLNSEVLQLSDSTVLLLNELALSEGKLQVQGISNTQALQRLITSQEVEYNFHFYKTTFFTPTTIFILSVGKSLFNVNCRIPLNKQSQPYHPVITAPLDPKYFLNAVRCYITLLRCADITAFSDDLIKKIEQDFVSQRQLDPNFTQENLHWWLTLVKFLSISYGDDKITITRWEEVKSLEKARLNRINPASQ